MTDPATHAATTPTRAAADATAVVEQRTSAGHYVNEDGRAYQIDLDDCAREPIHLPDLVQPHGVLIVLSESLRVAQISANADRLLNVVAGDALGQSLAELIGDEPAKTVARLLEQDRLESNPVRACAASVGGRGFDVVVHRNAANGSQVIVELEPVETDPADRRAGVLEGFDALRGGLARLGDAGSLQAMCEGVCGQIQRLCGFDRAMVYRFDPDHNGQVVAEAIAPQKAGQIEPFLGLNYPSSDIPAQARALYLRNWLRLIPDIEYEPVGLVPPTNAANLERNSGRREMPGRLDMSFATLRSVSPLHVEYLKNMGVRATMTVSLVQSVRGEQTLWGLIACHHYHEPKFVPFTTRAECELLGQVLSMQISRREAEEAAQGLAKRRRLVSLMAGRLADPAVDATAALVDGEANLMDLIDCGGAAVVSGQTIRTLGRTPDLKSVREIAAWAAARCYGKPEDEGSAPPLTSATFETDRLGEAEPRFACFADVASGVLVAPLAPGGGEAILWFRPEASAVQTWAGDPDKHVEVQIENGQIRLSPRKSFEKWQRDVRGRSLPWQPGEIAAAAELRGAVVEATLSRAEQLARLNEQLASSNEELESFAYVASHDLKEPLRGMGNLSHFLLEDYGDRLDDEGRRQLAMLARLSERMDGLINSLLHYSRVGRLELDRRPTDLNEVVAEATEMLERRLAETGGRVVVPRPLPTAGVDSTRIAEVFTNLISNALKYNDSPEPVVEIGYADDPPRPEGVEGEVGPAFYVRDNGIGIERRYFEQVFVIFKRLHARESYGGGSGAGLTIVRRVVERHGGRVWIESDPVRGGTTFWFTLGPE